MCASLRFSTLRHAWRVVATVPERVLPFYPGISPPCASLPGTSFVGYKRARDYRQTRVLFHRGESLIVEFCAHVSRPAWPLMAIFPLSLARVTFIVNFYALLSGRLIRHVSHVSVENVITVERSAERDNHVPIAECRDAPFVVACLLRTSDRSILSFLRTAASLSNLFSPMIPLVKIRNTFLEEK